MEAGSGHIERASRWRHDEFLHEYGFTFEDAVRQLEGFLVAHHPEEVALLAELRGAVAGICILCRRELEQRHDLTPWLASLVVAPELRGKGIGQALVRGIECHARSKGFDRIHLYTDVAEALYSNLGWNVEERFDWDGFPTVLMSRDL